MSTVLQLPVQSARRTGKAVSKKQRGKKKMAEVIIFPGVRIERHGEIDLSDRLSSESSRSEPA